MGEDVFRSAMECSSDESELSDADIDEYSDKAYMDLKSGKHLVKLGNEKLRCPFCLGKKKQDYRYNELLQHAIGVGASNRTPKVKANHMALANLLKNDYANATGSSSSQQDVGPSNPPRPLQDQEVYVWPWMGILANVPAEKTEGDGASLMQQLADFNPLQFTTVLCSEGRYTGYAVVGFSKDWIGFKNALAFQKYFKSQRLGKTDWAEHGQEKYICGWLAKEEDYKSSDPVGRFLSANGDLKTVSDLEHDLSCKTKTLIASLSHQITAERKYLVELQCKCNKMNLLVKRAMEETDLLHKSYNEAMRNMQSAAREHSQKIFQETDQLRKQLDDKENAIERRSKKLRKFVAQTDMERRKLESEMKKNSEQNDSIHMARIEQQKSDKNVLKLVEKHKKEEIALNKILQLEKQLDEKQKLELE